MSNIAMRILHLLAVCCFLAAIPAFAQTPLAPVERNGVTYITGGVGEDEAHAFRQAAPRYNLRLTFASKTGQYLSDVDVRISSGERTVLAVRTDGPFLFVRLPAGSYRVSARDRQVTEARQVAVPRTGGVDLRFYWDDPARRGITRLCSNCPRRPQ
ncbi:hypothetical protein [Paraburkholderia sp. SOS3]|jgi:hypothetical protein|uniref:hypothetical protein n=1 Tax=Paraburkholderia sp. SOS3 TaxID=1926494 RepID=UPI0009475A73|nr:hypothetical protein BTO02_04450 [Paraburkholderia sp. SOS3]